MCRRLDAPARINTSGIAVEEQAQHHRRVIRDRTGATVAPGERRQIELIDDVDHEARQVILGQPVLHRGRQQKRRGAIYRTEIDHGYTLGIIKRDSLMTKSLTYRSARSGYFGRVSPTGC